MRVIILLVSATSAGVFFSRQEEYSTPRGRLGWTRLKPTLTVKPGVIPWVLPVFITGGLAGHCLHYDPERHTTLAFTERVLPGVL
jgi:hypothetical protein